MARAYSSYTPEEVEAMSPELRARYDAWAEKQVADPEDHSDDEEQAPEEQAPEMPVEKGIVTQEQADKLVADNYVVPDEVKQILVTQDGNVFYDGNCSSGVTHAIQQGLKMFNVNKKPQ